MIDKTDPTTSELAAALRQQNRSIEMLMSEVKKHDAEEKPFWKKFLLSSMGVLVVLLIQAIGLVVFLNTMDVNLVNTMKEVESIKQTQQGFITHNSEQAQHQLLATQIHQNSERISYQESVNKEQVREAKEQFKDLKKSIGDVIKLQTEQYKFMVEQFGHSNRRNTP